MTSAPKTFRIKSFGCQMNVYDGERMAELLGEHGMIAVDDRDDADLVVLNTCHIREKAADKAYSEVGRLRREDGSRPLVALAGCVAQAEGTEAKRRSTMIDMVVGPQAYHRLPEMVAEVAGGKRTYHWSDINMKLWESKAGSPSWYNPFPRITISEFENWSEVNNWAYSLFHQYNYELPSALEKKVTAWKQMSKGDKDEFARLAVRYVQDEVRYLGLEIGVNNYKPHEPKVVFANGYGDCKDKALLLATILRSADIPAYIALLSTSKRSRTYDAAASPDEFNHAIVAMQRGDSLQFIDATMSMQKGSLKENYVPAYGYALVVRENESALTYIQPGINYITEVTETLKVSYDDSSKLSVRSTYTGGRGDGIRNYFSESSMKDIRDEYVDYYRSLYKDAEMSGDIIYEDDSAANSVLVKEEYTIPDIWTNEDKKRSFYVRAKTIDAELPDLPPSSEEYPLALKYPLQINYTLKMEMPGSWSFPLDDVHIANGSYQFDFESAVTGNVITCKYYLKTFKDNIPATELAQYRTDHSKMLDVTQLNMYYNNEGTGAKPPFSINWSSIWVTFTGFFFMSLLFRRFNRMEVDVDFDRDSGWKIGGWMVVLGITLCLQAVMHAYSLFSQGYYSNSTWEILNDTKGVAAIAYTELSLSVVKLSFCLALIYWFLKRRDIFPKMFMVYVAMLITSNVFLYFWYTAAKLPEPYNGLAGEYIKLSFQSFVYGAIWCSYIIRSYRTRATFLKSYV